MVSDIETAFLLTSDFMMKKLMWHVQGAWRQHAVDYITQLQGRTLWFPFPWRQWAEKNIVHAECLTPARRRKRVPSASKNA